MRKSGETMEAPATRKRSRKGKSAVKPSVVWFEIPADDLERANRFYGALFDWKIEPSATQKDRWRIDTGGVPDTPDGSLTTRCHPQRTITVYVNVQSVASSMARVEKLGGKVCTPKMAVPKSGYFAICQDTENNTFALWESDEKAK